MSRAPLPCVGSHGPWILLQLPRQQAMYVLFRTRRSVLAETRPLRRAAFDASTDIGSCQYSMHRLCTCEHGKDVPCQTGRCAWCTQCSCSCPSSISESGGRSLRCRPWSQSGCQTTVRHTLCHAPGCTLGSARTRCSVITSGHPVSILHHAHSSRRRREGRSPRGNG